jgi:hypothetical protein
MKTTAAQQRVIAAIRSGSMKTAQTGTRDGNVVRGLIDAGVVTAAHIVSLPAEKTYRGRRIPAARSFIGLAVK